MAIKTDMSKAYDRVELCFLETFMRKIGFAESWISWIITCVNSVSYRVLLNGETKGSIIPSRGLRKGDSLSPYLFIICTEVLIPNIRAAEESCCIMGIKVAHTSPSISHLLFADDSILCKVTSSQSNDILRILHRYRNASCNKLVLRNRPSLLESQYLLRHRKILKIVWGSPLREVHGSIYVPEQLQGSKTQIFAYVRDLLNQQINGWSAKFLSKGENEIMIKSVAQAISTYVMSCFLLPKWLCQTLARAVANFLWSTNPIQKICIEWLGKNYI